MKTPDGQMSASEWRTAPIIVGVDDSSAGRPVLEWAATLAEQRGRRVLVISTYPARPIRAAKTFPGMGSESSNHLADGRRLALLALIGEIAQRHPHAPMEANVVEGQAAGILVQASRYASTLVVGSRGRSALVGLLLGSVARGCVARAHCPVVVVGPRALVEEYLRGPSQPALGVDCVRADRLRWPATPITGLDGSGTAAHSV
jgi:nucleotide-binding universal stress UspA family protein